MSANNKVEHDDAEGLGEGPTPQGLPEPEVPGPEAERTPQTPAEASSEGELERARAEVAELLDKFLRAKAETENIRRRAEIDVANAHKYGIERFVSELLPVRDSLELARTVDIEQENHVALQKMHEGLDLTLKLMEEVFSKFGLVVIDPKGEKFDPERHQAMTVVPSETVAAGHVVQVMQKGYMLYDRLLRPALVTVASAPEAPRKGDLT